MGLKLLLLVGLLGCTEAEPVPLVVLAPSHTRGALQRVAWEWGERAGQPVQLVYETSEEIERLIDTGATADVLLATAEAALALETRRHLVPGSRRVVVGDQLVVARGTSVPGPPLRTPADLLDPRIGTVRVPPEGSIAGQLARRQLAEGGLWETLSDKRVEAAGTSALVEALRQSETDVGVLEGSVVQSEPELQVALVLNEGAGQAPIVYEAAVVAHSDVPEAAGRFVGYLAEERVRAAFLRVGFRAATGIPTPAPDPGAPAPPAK